MYHIIGTYNPSLVFLSLIISILASYTAIDFAGKLKPNNNIKWKAPKVWLFGGSVVMGTGIWSMHFVAMLAFHLDDRITYHFWKVVLSVIIAILASFIAFSIVSLRTVQKKHWILGSVFMGLGIVSMHFVGMDAMQNVLIEYDPKLVGLSVIVAIVVSAVALWIVNKTYRNDFFRKILSSVFMGAAICGMHYSGMAAAKFTAISESSPSFHINHVWLARGIGFSTLLILILGLISIFIDRRFRAMEQHHNSLFRHNPDPVFLLRLDGRVMNANAMAKQILPHSASDYVKQPFTSFLVSHEVTRFLEYFHKTLEGNGLEFEIGIIHQNGSPVDFRIKTIPMIIDDEVQGVYLLCKDISQYKQAREENEILWQRLQKSEENYRQLIELSDDLITQGSLDNRYTYVSPSSKSLLGYEPDEMIGTSCADHIHPDDYTDLIKKLDTHISNIRHTYRIRRKDDTYIWFESNIKKIVDPQTKQPVSYITFSRDVTERKIMEGEISRREEEYRKLVEDMPHGVFIVQDHKCVYINQTAVELMAANSKDDIIDQNIFTFIHPDFRDIKQERMNQVIKGQNVELLEEKFIRFDGEWIDVEVKTIQIHYRGQPALHIMFHDITELKKSREMLQRSETLSAIGELAAGIAHEIRNPLTSLKGFIQLFQHQLKDKTNRHLDIMHSEIDRINTIVGEMLWLAKPKKMDFENKPLLTLIENVIALVQPEATLHNVQIITCFKSTIPFINCVENKIKQVFINILKNAIEAMPNGGKIHVEVEVFGTEVSIRFIDEGSGIPEEQLANIGRAFFTTKDKGTGLGTMISYNILHSHQGEMKIESEVNKGTTVEVVLPIADSITIVHEHAEVK
jgi:two-component system sporulation sensor kinase A